MREGALLDICHDIHPAIQAGAVEMGRDGLSPGGGGGGDPPERGAESDVAHEDDIQQNERGGEEPVDIAGIVDAAQVAVRICNINTATVSTLQGRGGRDVIGRALQICHGLAGLNPCPRSVYGISLQCARSSNRYSAGHCHTSYS